MREIGQVVEGYVAAKAVRSVARRTGVDMPLCEGIHGVLYEQRPAKEVVRGLMGRPIKAETE
jgi:glycerol-3-phosphate dehydrogenase (NAD(P)+)